jgi:hypothetical protein
MGKQSQIIIFRVVSGRPVLRHCLRLHNSQFTARHTCVTIRNDKTTGTKSRLLQGAIWKQASCDQLQSCNLDTGVFTTARYASSISHLATCNLQKSFKWLCSSHFVIVRGSRRSQAHDSGGHGSRFGDQESRLRQ